MYLNNKHTEGDMSDLTEKKCKPCEGCVEPMSTEAISTMLDSINGWQFKENRLTKTWVLKNHYQAISLVNAIAWIANQEGHHPTLTITYNQCTIEYTTHAAKGLTENDFICAAKIDNLI